MTEQELGDKKRHFREAMSDFKKTGRISECFYHDKTTCNGHIKQSHSLQRNGRLSIIEGEVNENQVIYSFTENEISETTSHETLKPIGKASASTFFGFCDHHDTVLFSRIENNPYDESDEHSFLHSYRSFAHSYHRKNEELKAHTTKSKFTEALPKEFLDEAIKGLEMGVKDQLHNKHKLDRLIERKEYDGLEYINYIIPEKFPLACSSQISPYYSYKGTPINNHTDGEKPFSPIMLTVLPDVDQTIIILACFPDDKEGVIFLDELYELSNLKFEKAISSVLVNCAENTFFSPKLWNALGQTGQRLLCDELVKAASRFHMPDKFEHSKINFFDYKYSEKRLV